MVTNNLDLLREQARQFEALKNAPELLRQVEAEAQQQNQLQATINRAARLESDALTALNAFQADKGANDASLQDALSLLKSILDNRQKLAQRAQNIEAIARGMAEAQLSAGLKFSPLGAQSAIAGVAQDFLKLHTGKSTLQFIDNLELQLLNILDAMTTVAQKQPARFTVETAHGNFAEVRY